MYSYPPQCAYKHVCGKCNGEHCDVNCVGHDGNITVIKHGLADHGFCLFGYKILLYQDLYSRCTSTRKFSRWYEELFFSMTTQNFYSMI